MSNELFEISGQAYEGFNLVVCDVRTFIERTKRKYDFITMLNTHRIWSMGHQGAPEYIHTLEAMNKYIDHLKDDGYLILEERNINEQADLGIRRVVHTAKAALLQHGVADPSKHIMIWERNSYQCPKKAMAANPSSCKRDYLFTFVGIKRTPITTAEFDHLIEWEKTLGRIANSEISYSGFIWRYLPQLETNHYWTDVVKADSLYDTLGADPAAHNLDVIMDDKPFPFDIFKARTRLWETIRNVSLLALLMVFIPAAIAFLSLRGSDRTGRVNRYFGINALMIVYFGILGIAYLVVEIVLMQKFGVFLSSPVWSLAVILSTMLIASGIGGYVFRKVTRKGALAVFVATMGLGGLFAAGLDTALSTLIFLPFSLRVFIAIGIVSPLAFLMGIPFPYGMSLTKTALTARHAGLFFGINGAFGAVASPLTLFLTMAIGLRITLLLGFGLYALAGALIGSAIALMGPAKSA
jgi:hypothetical protein